MKRRNADFSKLRRPVKKSKIAEGLYGSSFMYIKFLLVWALVLLADFILEFRFEYLWPAWLLFRSVYDSFKFQGLAFSVFFVFLALTSDMICFLFIPVQWLFFAASTYVWVQYVWQTEKGICLPTVSLWLLFVYIEASVRLKELKNLPFHLDLCRPFAAHCIGYPVVTLGFGFKSYVSYKMRLRKQREVAKENEMYIELLQKALPQETATTQPDMNVGDAHIISNGIDSHINNSHKNVKPTICSSEKINIQSKNKLTMEYDSKKVTQNGIDKHELQYMEFWNRIPSVNEFEDDDNGDISNISSKATVKNLTSFSSPKSGSQTSSHSASLSSLKLNHTGTHTNHVTSNFVTNSTSIGNGSPPISNISGKKAKNLMANCLPPQKDDHAIKLEADIKKLKADLQGSNQCQSDLRMQINGMLSSERELKCELMQYKQDNDNLQTKLHNLVTARQQDKQTILQLEKRVSDEKKLKASLESQLISEKKAKKAEEAATARAIASATRTECSENCKAKRRELENDVKQYKRELKLREEQLRQMERETQSLRQYKDSLGDTELLMSALSAMQDKNTHLESSLSAETRLKLDLFSALGDTKRQLEINHVLIMQKEKEIDELKSKIAEVIAVMPPTSTSSSFALDTSLVSSILYNSKLFMNDDDHSDFDPSLGKSGLDPNASIYTPKH